MNDRFKGKSILVTGGSSGIGLGIGKELARSGASVVLSGTDASKLSRISESEFQSSDRVRTAAVDLSNVGEIESWLVNLARDVGPFEGLVHAAGIHQTLPLRFQKLLDVEKIFRVNVFSAIALMKAFRRKEVSKRPSAAVFISSVTATTPVKGAAAYCASKAALESFCKSIAVELSGEGVRVNCVAPAFVETPMLGEFLSHLDSSQSEQLKAQHPLGIGRVEDVARAVAYLLSEESAWVTGSTLVVDGGYSATK